ncbi:hypothetical protein ACFLTH_09575 [Bacteroidota bacterium]
MAEIDNHGKLPNLEGRIPNDFIHEKETETPTRLDLGTKTRLAIKIPSMHEGISAYQVKLTAYGPLGLGKVTHFDYEGLQREFFFRQDKLGIKGVVRKYNHINKTIKLKSENSNYVGINDVYRQELPIIIPSKVNSHQMVA